MAAYFMIDIAEVIDPEGFESYREQVVPLVQKYDGKYLAVDDQSTAVEGDWQPGIAVLIEFPTMERLQEWYNAEEYAPLIELRKRSTRAHFVAINGLR